MKNILQPKFAEILLRAADPAACTLLAFDFDGTLAPIVAVPSRAKLSSRTARLLKELHAHFPLAAISGRSFLDLRRRIGRAKFDYEVGNHGMDWGTETSAGRRYERQVKGWMKKLLPCAAQNPGVALEDKQFSLSVHYRSAPRPLATHRAILRAARKLGGVRLIEGKYVVNLVPKGAPDKGVALLELMELTGSDRAVYVGDDVTDEDVFRLAKRPARKSRAKGGRRPRSSGPSKTVPPLSDRLVCIRVGSSRKSAAPYFIPEQAEIDTLLRILLRARKAEASPSKSRRI